MSSRLPELGQGFRANDRIRYSGSLAELGQAVCGMIEARNLIPSLPITFQE